MSEKPTTDAEPTVNDGWPELSSAVELVAADPQEARSRVRRLTGAVAVAAVPAFLDHAVATFLAAGHTAEAGEFFDLARQVEETHESLLGLDPGFERAHRSFLEFAPAGVVTSTAVYHRLKRLARHPDPRTAHRQGREMVEVFFDAGTIPYPRVLADLLPLAVAAGIAQSDEEDYLAERMLRAGLFAAAALPTWEAAAAAIGRLCRRMPELTDLLVASRPVDGLYDDAGPAEKVRTIWMDLLADAGAGKDLPRSWFFAAGPTGAPAFVTLADQAGTRLFPPRPGPQLDADSDPAIVATRRPDPLGFLAQEKPDPAVPKWQEGTDFDALLASLDDPSARAGFLQDLDVFVRNLNHYDNVDYQSLLRHVWRHPGMRRMLVEQVAEWLIEARADDLRGLEIALPRLVPLVEAGFADLEPDLFAGVVLADPVDALLQALRGGVAEELRFPTVEIAGRGPGPVTVVQHEGHLTIGVQGKAIQVYDGDGVRHRQHLAHTTEALPWYDGQHCYLSRYANGVRQTFRVDGDSALSLDAATAMRWPAGAAHAELTFPGADAPSLLRMDLGEIRLSAPDGRTTARLRFAPVQQVPAGTHPVLPPPGWWPRLQPADPAGSAALRAVERDTVTGLVEAALRGPGRLGQELTRLLPQLSEPRLREAVESLAQRASQALVQVLRLRDGLSQERPAMPDDPAGLWTDSLDVDRLARWWQLNGEALSSS